MLTEGRVVGVLCALKELQAYSSHLLGQHTLRRVHAVFSRTLPCILLGCVSFGACVLNTAS